MRLCTAWDWSPIQGAAAAAAAAAQTWCLDTDASSHSLVSLSWQGPAAELTAAGPASRHPELFKAMAAGIGQDSTALVSPSWPHALRLLQVSTRGWPESVVSSRSAPAMQLLHMVVLRAVEMPTKQYGGLLLLDQASLRMQDSRMTGFGQVGAMTCPCQPTIYSRSNTGACTRQQACLGRAWRQSGGRR
jgi:hypothetical protein